MSKGSERFHELLKELGELHDIKQADYGSDEDPFANVRATEQWGIPAWVGATIRLGDKVQRLKSMWRNGYLKNESVEDSLRDIAVYSLIGLVLYEEAMAENTKLAFATADKIEGKCTQADIDVDLSAVARRLRENLAFDSAEANFWTTFSDDAS